MTVADRSAFPSFRARHGLRTLFHRNVGRFIAGHVTTRLADAATRDVSAFSRANGCAGMPMRSRIGPTFPCTPDELDALPLLPL